MKLRATTTASAQDCWPPARTRAKSAPVKGGAEDGQHRDEARTSSRRNPCWSVLRWPAARLTVGGLELRDDPLATAGRPCPTPRDRRHRRTTLDRRMHATKPAVVRRRWRERGRSMGAGGCRGGCVSGGVSGVAVSGVGCQGGGCQGRVSGVVLPWRESFDDPDRMPCFCRRRLGADEGMPCHVPERRCPRRLWIRPYLGLQQISSTRRPCRRCCRTSPLGTFDEPVTNDGPRPSMADLRAEFKGRDG